MSEIMLGVLEMPDDLFWSDEMTARNQHNQIRKEAAAEIRRLRRENSALCDAWTQQKQRELIDGGYKIEQARIHAEAQLDKALTAIRNGN